MSKKNGVSATKIIFKLPSNINRGDIIGACSTDSRASIEGYRGTITVVKEYPKQDEGFLLCRPIGHAGKAWVQVKT